MRLNQVAHARSGDKGTTNTLTIFPYDNRDFHMLSEVVTTEALKRHLGGRVLGRIHRWVLPNLGALHFVLEDMARGDVTLATELDAHGKSLSGIALDLEVHDQYPWYGRRNASIVVEGLKIPQDVIEDEYPILITAAGAGLDPECFAELRNFGFLTVHLDYLAGHGPFDITKMADVLASQLRMRTAPTIVAGQSLGGALLLMVAGMVPSSISAALIADTGLSTQGHADQGLAQRIAANWNEESVIDFLSTCFATLPPEETWHKLVDYALSTDPEALAFATASLRATDITQYAKSITAPLSVIFGIHDQRRNIDHARQISRCVEGSRLYLLDCGHTPMLERSQEYQGLMDGLLIRAGIHPDRNLA